MFLVSWYLRDCSGKAERLLSPRSSKVSATASLRVVATAGIFLYKGRHCSRWQQDVEVHEVVVVYNMENLLLLLLLLFLIVLLLLLGLDPEIQSRNNSVAQFSEHGCK